MRRLLLLGLATCVAGWLAWRYGAAILPFGAVTPQVPNPEDGKVTSGAYTNRYFGLSYPLPQGWAEAVAGPDPSHSGYYVLSTLSPTSELTGNVLIAAQDTFFAAEGRADAAAAVDDVRQTMSNVEGMTIDREPSEVKIAGRLLRRVDFSGVGLYRAVLVAGIRCHLVSFNLTARDPELLSSLARGLDSLSFAEDKDVASAVPTCVKDYAVDKNLLSKVEPVMTGSMGTSIPVRIIVGTDGGVKHVHVIRATAEQRKAIEEALRQWRFRRYEVEGRPVEIETGLMFQARPSAM